MKTQSSRMLSTLLFAVVVGLSAVPAQADDWGHDRGRHNGWREHEWREHEWRRGGHGPVYVVPGYGYAPPPPVYYVPPPVVYAPPPPVYSAPGISIFLRP
jgi:hypothetical protein